MPEPSDEDLMARVAQGDRLAYRALIDRHIGRAVGFAQRMLGSRAEAEDAVQDAFLRVWQHGSRWDGTKAGFRTWFYRILTNLVIDRKRKPRTDPIEAAGDPADPALDPEAALSRNRTTEAVASAVADLPERQRAAILLCHFQGLSNIEAAASLSLTVGAVESLLVRARRALKERLAAFQGG